MFIEAPELTELPGVRHAFFSREGGASEGIYRSLNGGLGSSDDPDRVADNRRRMAAHFRLPSEALVSLHQVHSPDAIVVERAWSQDERPQADGMATKAPSLILGISTADCGPVLLADANTGVIGAAHAGWKGAFSGVLEATLDAMETLGAGRHNTVAVLGPTIGSAAYEVGPGFSERFAVQDPKNNRFFRPSERAGHAMFDLPGYIGARLMSAGVGRFVDLGLCTYSDEKRFYSYRRATHRRESDYGRLIATIAIKL